MLLFLVLILLLLRQIYIITKTIFVHLSISFIPLLFSYTLNPSLYVYHNASSFTCLYSHPCLSLSLFLSLCLLSFSSLSLTHTVVILRRPLPTSSFIIVIIITALIFLVPSQTSPSLSYCDALSYSSSPAPLVHSSCVSLVLFSDYCYPPFLFWPRTCLSVRLSVSRAWCCVFSLVFSFCPCICFYFVQSNVSMCARFCLYLFINASVYFQLFIYL